MRLRRHTGFGWWLGGLVILLGSIVWVGRGQAASEPTAAPAPTEAVEVSTADHTKFEILKQPFQTAPEVTKACLSCHTEAAKQVMATTHWTWVYQDPDSAETWGKRYVINNFCVAVVSNWPRCTSCHVGYGWKDDSFDFTNELAVDCLVCHDTTGQYKKFPAGAGHPVYEPKEFPPGSGNIWEPPDLSYIAQHVGPTSRRTCGACHFYGGGGDGVKHGDMDSTLAEPPKDVDVHMSPDGANMTCGDCHKPQVHAIPGSRYRMVAKDTHGKDLPKSDGFPTSCESCHGLTPHDMPKINDHVDRVACQTCHIPTFARGNKPTKLWWDWSVAGDKARGIEKDEHGWEVYNFMKGEFRWGKDVVPVYRWFNGRMEVMTLGEPIDPEQPVYINQPQGSPDDPNSRIYPFKEFRGKQGYDPVNRILLVPHLFPFNPEDTTAFWKGFDWGPAFEVGMKTAGLPYSGQYDWIETTMYWPITHMVAPAEQALSCQACHTRQGRLATLADTVYIPAQSSHPWVDRIGWTLTGLTVLGVLVHAGLRLVSRRKS
ncbi:MAG: tetrathionate reductase family octaheme c-type cytochrome [Chloroflexi bacterium]|nr:tetrathionate reductase family octaheme c-type cytochrome [Chloroflexota bacterium]